MQRVLAGLAGLLLVAGTRAEGLDEGFFRAGVQATGHAFDITGRQRPDIDNAALAGLQLSYRFTPRWALRGWYETGDYQQEERVGEGELRTARVSVQRHFPDLDLVGFSPHVGVDAADLRVDPGAGSADNETLLGVAFGLGYSLGRRWRLDLGGRQTHSLDAERRDGQLYLGLKRRLGALGSGPSPDLGGGADDDGPGFKVKDSDGDGVANPMDDCPGTPAGADVNGAGCAGADD
jgi:OOP family OmpA-OmpF porin